VFDIDRLQFVEPEEFTRIETEHGESLPIYTDAGRMEAELLRRAPENAGEIRRFAAGSKVPQADPRCSRRPAAIGDLVIASRCGEVRIRRAELAEYDMRRSTIRRPRDDMPGSTIRRPSEPASDVAKIASSLRRLEPPARAT
jgi:phytoene dehydrogenase-like protein